MSAGAEFNYAETGHTQDALLADPPGSPAVTQADRPHGVPHRDWRDGLPRGYRHLRVARRLPGSNFAAVAQALLTWGVHAKAGVRLASEADRAAPGLDVATCIGLGRAVVEIPCRVVWVEDSADRAAFGYGCLTGHPFAGEEAFQVERRPNGELWFVVVAYSRPDRWFIRIAGPLVPLFQRAYLIWLARAAGRISKQPSVAAG